MTERKTIPAISLESQEVIRRLEKCQPGDFVPYEELNKIVMGDIQNGKRYALSTARNRLLRERHMVFEVVRNEGVKRLTDEEVVALSEDGVMKIRRHSKRAARKLVCVEFEGLSETARIKHNARMSIFAVLSSLTKPKSQALIEERVSQAQSRLDMSETLRLFGGRHD